MAPTKVLIVYASDYGNTKKMAEHVEKGAKEVAGVEVHLHSTDTVTYEITKECDALILGSPVHMGSPHWKVKKFIDEICGKLWMKDRLVGKVGAVFVSGGGFGSAGGGCELTLLALLNNLVELGLIIIPLPKNTPGYLYSGIQWGPYGRTMGANMEQTGIEDKQLEVCWHHGKNIARAAHELKGKTIFGP